MVGGGGGGLGTARQLDFLSHLDTRYPCHSPGGGLVTASQQKLIRHLHLSDTAVAVMSENIGKAKIIFDLDVTGEHFST